MVHVSHRYLAVLFTENRDVLCLLTCHVGNWGAWPQANQEKIDTGEDIAYRQALQGKKYMMGVSPYFYTSKHREGGG